MTTKFGWCLDGHHAQCWAVVERTRDVVVGATREAMRCGCECHGDSASA